jgi:drug/metabolite transporter superfamily protein YnfA
MIGAALLETGGDAMIRHGLARQWLFLAAGAASLVIYGILVNQGSLDFGRLMGCYIAVFFVVSQVIAWLFFHQVPAIRTLFGGALIVAGGLAILG